MYFLTLCHESFLWHSVFWEKFIFYDYLEVPHFESNMIITLCVEHSLLRALVWWQHIEYIPVPSLTTSIITLRKLEMHSQKHYPKSQYLIEQVSPSYLTSWEMFYLLTLISLFFHSQFRISLSGSLETVSILVEVALFIDQCVDN